MKRHRLDIGVALLTIVFVYPSTFQLTLPAISILDFYVTVVEVCVLTLLFWWALRTLGRLDQPVRRVAYDGPMIVVLAVILLSAVMGLAAYGPTKVLGDARQYLPLFLYFWATRSLSSPERLERLRARLLGVQVVVALYVIVVFLFFRGYLAEETAAAGRRVIEDRVFFDNTLFLIFLYSGLLLVRLVATKRPSRLDGIVLAMNVLMLMVMQVRTYWIAFMFIVAYTAWSHRDQFLTRRVAARATLLLPALLAASVAVYLVVGDTGALGSAGTSLVERAKSLVNFKETFLDSSQRTASEVETLSTRLETAKVAWNDYIAPNPVLGIGLGGEIPVVNALGAVVLWKYQIDNGYLTILAKFGFVGLAAYGLVLLLVIRRLLRAARSGFATAGERALAHSLLAGIGAALIASGFSSVFVRQQPSIVAFLVLLAEAMVLEKAVDARRRKAGDPQQVEFVARAER